MLAVAEEPPYAALCFDVWSTEEVEGTGQVRVMACFEDEGDGYSYIAGRTSTQMQGFKRVLYPIDGGKQLLTVYGDNSESGAAAYSFSCGGEEYTVPVGEDGFVLDMLVLPVDGKALADFRLTGTDGLRIG